VREMTKEGWKIIAGDFSKFDLSVPFVVRNMVYRLLFMMAKKMGYNDSALKILNGIFSDMLFPVIIAYLDAFVIPGIHPSGSAYTAELNCIVVLIILVSAFYCSPHSKGLDFFEEVVPRNYGDDENASVSPKIQSWFTNFYMRDFCKTILNMEYTPSVKNGTMVAHEEITESTFLKRRFVYREDLKRWVAPLSLDSILRCLSWYIPSKSIDRREQFRSMCISTCYEIALHGSYELYDDYIRMIVKEFNDGFGYDFSGELPTLDDIYYSMFGDGSAEEDNFSNLPIDDENLFPVECEEAVVAVLG